MEEAELFELLCAVVLRVARGVGLVVHVVAGLDEADILVDAVGASLFTSASPRFGSSCRGGSGAGCDGGPCLVEVEELAV